MRVTPRLYPLRNICHNQLKHINCYSSLFYPIRKSIDNDCNFLNFTLYSHRIRKGQDHDKRSYFTNFFKKNLLAQYEKNSQTLDENDGIEISTNSENMVILKSKLTGVKIASFHSIWLRDHCRCENCYHSKTKQRLLDTAKIPLNIKPNKLSLSKDMNSLLITWCDGHESHYRLRWLMNSQVKNFDYFQSPKTLWGRDMIDHLPTVTYEEVMESNQGLKKWLQNISQYGIGFVQGCPADPKKTEELSRKIAFVRETHYGGFWDFSPNMEHGDTAYTNIALPAHTDTTYFTDPIGLQIFHLLKHDGKGGESLFVDGFQCAKQLFHESPSAYQALSEMRIPSACAGDDSILIKPTPYAFPILNHDPITNELFQIRFNNDDRAVLNTLKPNQIKAFYSALKHWIEILKSHDNELWVQLKPGQVVAIDNWRVLHGRAAFTGYRRMVGCYINHDDYASQLRVICHGHHLKNWI